jgi:hypothetical protein
MFPNRGRDLFNASSMPASGVPPSGGLELSGEPQRSVLHNVQQISSAKRLDPDWPGLLPLTEDPLAYLGILVDIIQEWNRYSVFKDLDREPIQGIEVKLGAERGKVLVQFLEPNASSRAAKLEKDLDKTLDGWRELVEVRS